MNYKILLTNPTSKLPFYDLAPRFPIGLAYLQGTLKQNNFASEILNFLVEPEPGKKILENFNLQEKIILGLYVTTPSLNKVYKFIKFFKKNYKNSLVVVGGPHLNSVPSAVQDLKADFGIWGDGEFAFLKLCQILVSEKNNFSEVSGLIYNNNDQWIINTKEIIKDINDLPFPERTFNLQQEYRHPLTGNYRSSVITSRGCPFSCSFCAVARDEVVRFRNIENILQEINEIYSLGIKEINFLDETFTLNKKRTEELCKGIIKSKIKISWDCQTRADMLNKKLLLIMKQAGCKGLMFGVESGSFEIRKSLGKNISNEKYIKAIKLCEKLALEVHTSWMLGNPGETKEDLHKTINFAKYLNTRTVNFNLTLILPETILFRIAKDEAKVNEKMWNDFKKDKVNYPIYIPEGVTKDYLINLQISVLKKYYLRKKYFKKHLIKLNVFYILKLIYKFIVYFLKGL